LPLYFIRFAGKEKATAVCDGYSVPGPHYNFPMSEKKAFALG